MLAVLGFVLGCTPTTPKSQYEKAMEIRREVAEDARRPPPHPVFGKSTPRQRRERQIADFRSRLVNAYEMLQRACDADYLPACLERGRMISQYYLYELEQKPGTARHLFSKACDGGLKKACSELRKLEGTETADADEEQGKKRGSRDDGDETGLKAAFEAAEEKMSAGPGKKAVQAAHIAWVEKPTPPFGNTIDFRELTRKFALRFSPYEELSTTFLTFRMMMGLSYAEFASAIGFKGDKDNIQGLLRQMIHDLRAAHRRFQVWMTGEGLAAANVSLMEEQAALLQKWVRSLENFDLDITRSRRPKKSRYRRYNYR